MKAAFYEHLNWFFGLEMSTLSIFHMMARAFFVYFLGVIIIFFNKRFVGERTPFDIMLKFIIGSMLANAITGNSPFFATTGMVMFLIFLNWLLSYVAFHSAAMDHLIKGKAVVLYKNNQFHKKAMKATHITQDDIMSEIRKITGITSLEHVKEVIFENTGEISVIPYEPRHISQRTDVESGI